MATSVAAIQPAAAASTLYAADGDLISDRTVQATGGHHLELEAETRVGDQKLFVTTSGQLVLVDSGGSNYWAIVVGTSGNLTTVSASAPS